MTIQSLPDGELKDKLKKYIFDTVGCCMDVHEEKGPALTEYIYQDCLEIALSQKDIKFVREYFFHPYFRGIELKSSLRVDFLIKDRVFLECKAIEQLSNCERIQLTNYMRNAGVRIGILFNFYPLKYECERFYYNPEDNSISYF